jgi:hypothetical protein
MRAALRARVVDGHLVVVGTEHLPEGMEFDLVPVSQPGGVPTPANPANDRAPTLLDLLGCELPDEAFTAMLDRPKDLPPDRAL